MENDQFVEAVQELRLEQFFRFAENQGLDLFILFSGFGRGSEPDSLLCFRDGFGPDVRGADDRVVLDERIVACDSDAECAVVSERAVADG